MSGDRRIVLAMAAGAVLASVGGAPRAVAQSRGLLAACDVRGGGEKNSTSMHSDDGRRKWRISWSNDACSIDMRAEGVIDFERDLSDVRSISRGGYLEIDVRTDGERRRYEVANENGQLERHYTVNRTEQPIDAEARRWIAAMLLELERRSGFAAESRVADLLRAGGPAAVMAEVGQMSSDFVQRRYLSVMLDSAKLSAGEARAAMTLAGKELESDYELASFLVDLGKRGYVNPDVASDFVAATGSIQSDYEKRRALGAVLTLKKLPPATVGALLQAAESIGSDYERAELLIATVKANGFPDGAARDAYLGAAKSIGSDYEKHRVLSRLTDAELTDEQLIALLGTAKDIGSDYELASLLVELTRSRTLSGRARDAYIATAESIGSDYERRRALSALVRAPERGRM